MWRWSAEYDTPAKRKKLAIKFGDITSQFVEVGSHPAIGEADVASFRSAVDAEWGGDENNRPFVFDDYGKCVVISYPNSARLELVPKIAAIGQRFGLNASEF